MFAAMMSFAVIVVLVKSLVVLDCSAVPDDNESPLVEMELETVGIAVPEAIFQNFTVNVPASANSP